MSLEFGPVDPETAAFYARLATEAAAATTAPRAYDLEAERAEREAAAAARSPIAHDRSVPTPSGTRPLRVFVPDSVRGVYLYIHGGCWVSGGYDQQDERLEAIALAHSVAVASVSYRLAPDHPYPAAPDDCEAAARWVVEHAGAELGSDRIVIAGGSAGAHLAAVTLLRMRDRHGYGGFAAADLTYGIYDVAMTPSMARYGGPRPGSIFCTPRMEFCSEAFVPPERRRDPDVSPLYADLQGLPPALFVVGTNDPLLDDSLFMHARWLAAGNTSELGVFPGGSHGFTRHPIPIAERARAQQAAFLERAFASEDGAP